MTFRRIIDSNYVALGSFIIPYGTSIVTSGMISQSNYPGWPGFASLSANLSGVL